MRIFMNIIYTDKVNEVRDFWDTHFQLETDRSLENSFTVFPLGEIGVQYMDAATAGVAPSQNILFRWLLPYPVLERARLIAAGVPCSELKTAHWGHYFGEQVQYFEVADPSGAVIQIFSDHFGEAKQLMTTGDGTGTRQVHQKAE